MTKVTLPAETQARIERLTERDPYAPVLVYTRMDAVERREISWLWEGWLARGKLTILGGHPGDGKSTLTAALVAEFSRGGTLPDGARAPIVNAALLLAEDDLGDTVRPRLEVHGADVGRVFAIQGIRDADGKDRFLSLAGHVDLIQQLVQEHDIGLLVIDPLTSFLPRTDRNSEGDIRDALMPVLRLAEEARLAIIGIMHVGKASGIQRTPLQSLLGSTAFGAVARIVWMVAKVPESGDRASEQASIPHRLLGVVKSNVSVTPSALAWSRTLDEPIAWHGPSGISIEEAMTGAEPARPRVEATAFLHEQLKGGMKRSEEVKQLAREKGITESTLRRARTQLRVQIHRDGFQGSVWWGLPTGPGVTPVDSEPSGSGSGASAAQARPPPVKPPDAVPPSRGLVSIINGPVPIRAHMPLWAQ